MLSLPLPKPAALVPAWRNTEHGVGGGGWLWKARVTVKSESPGVKTSGLPFAGFVTFGKSLHFLKVNTNSFVKD